MKIISVLLLSFVSALSYSTTASPNENSKPFYIDNPYFKGKYSLKAEEVKSFFLRIKEAVKLDDKYWISTNTSYPIEISRQGKTIKVTNAKDFIKNYEFILTKEIQQAVNCQKFDNLFVNWMGIMVGQGAIWFKLKNIEAPIAENKTTMSPPVNEDISNKPIDINDRTKWQYRIFSINNDTPVKEFAKNCIP